ncbi:hypothetical protein RUM43_013180 [Polyplax serrata]|uniref:UV-stimulated scaffold protein A C-terminal domain-containing protein n=1 Tax=Polyplax serrata TaxID=468196 RepID=A0AAN8P2G8_POLSC
MEGDNENSDHIKKLGVLIEALTHSGSNTLDEDLFKQVKKICKSSQIYISKAYEILLLQLKKKNSQIRYLAFQICKEFFSRSAQFRLHLLNNLELIFKLTAEINSKSSLPPPKPYAQTLKKTALQTLQQWVNFETFEANNEPERLRHNDTERRQQLLNCEKTKQVVNEINSYQVEIEETLTSLLNCLKLLFPTPDDFFILEKKSTEEVQASSDNNISRQEEINENDLRHFGITRDYNLLLNININDKIKINRTDDNNSVIENAKDCVQLINNRFLPLIKRWSHILCKYSNETNDELKKILDMKQNLSKAVEKYKALDIDIEKTKEKDSSCSSDDEFEEVRKEGYEDNVEFSEEDLLAIKTMEKIKPSFTTKGNKILMSTLCDNYSLNEKDEPGTPGTSEDVEPNRKSKLLKVAPKLPFDIDLYHWEDENLTTPTLISTKIDVDKFWGCANSDDIHEIPNPEGTASLRTRVIEFTGKFEPVKWTCRTPLQNGKLCPRRDRLKCPFHGKIVPRDELGRCQNPEDDKKECQNTSAIPNWQDPQLLMELKASTGVDLKMPEKRGKKRKIENENLTQREMKTSAAALKIVKAKNLPGLVDVVKNRNTVYTRLSKKLFNRSTIKRVNDKLNKIDSKKFIDKFGDCFNYP